MERGHPTHTWKGVVKTPTCHAAPKSIPQTCPRHPIPPCTHQARLGSQLAVQCLASALPDHWQLQKWHDSIFRSRGEERQVRSGCEQWEGPTARSPHPRSPWDHIRTCQGVSAKLSCPYIVAQKWHEQLHVFPTHTALTCLCEGYPIFHEQPCLITWSFNGFHESVLGSR